MIRYVTGALFAGAGGTLLVTQMNKIGFAPSGADGDNGPLLADRVPTRAQQLAKMREGSREKPFDVLVIGGGATGAGCAADAATRGLKTVLIEREDFASGTSSKSTKLVHGGVRYLEKAVFQLDYSQLKLVWEALHERSAFLHNAPHLAHPLPIMTPCYHWFEVPYYWAGLKAYDFVAGFNNLIMSKFMNRTETSNFINTLAETNPTNGHSLKGSILYYDGQFDDARVNVSLAVTAAAAGGVVANHMECLKLHKNDNGQVIGAQCKDLRSDETYDVYAKVVINATGPFLDGVRKISDPAATKSVMGSAGTHITLPSFYGSGTVGLIIPKTKDGRVLFMLPWQGALIAGTTDGAADLDPKPRSTEEEVAFIIESLSDFLGVQVKRSDVLSAWAGIRPLPCPPPGKGGGTQNVVRDHLIFTDADGMVNVTGGKWTTYRGMAEETVNAAVATGRLPQNVGPCVTAKLPLVGGKNYKPTLTASLSQQYQIANMGAADRALPSVDAGVADHLAHSYGDRATKVLALAQERGLGAKLSPHHPILEAEVAYCVENEYCCTIDDFLERRVRLAFMDAQAALDSIPRVADIMAETSGWSKAQKATEISKATEAIKRCFFTGKEVNYVA